RRKALRHSGLAGGCGHVLRLQMAVGSDRRRLLLPGSAASRAGAFRALLDQLCGQRREHVRRGRYDTTPAAASGRHATIRSLRASQSIDAANGPGGSHPRAQNRARPYSGAQCGDRRQAAARVPRSGPPHGNTLPFHRHEPVRPAAGRAASRGPLDSCQCEGPIPTDIAQRLEHRIRSRSPRLGTTASIDPMHSLKRQTNRIYRRPLAVASLATAAAVAITAVSPVVGAKRPAAPLDVVRVTKLSDPAVAPDGRAALFMTDALSPGGRKRDRRLWRVQLHAPWLVRPLTEAAGDRRAAWSPDGRLIAFLRIEHGVSQVYAEPADGGPPRALSAVAGGVDDFSWAPDSRGILLTVPTPVGTARAKTPPDVRIFTRADYRDFLGYRDFDTRSRLRILPISNARRPAAARALTDEGRSATFAFWSADSKTVYFTYADPRPTYRSE